MKALLRRKNIEFEEIKLVTDEEIAEFKENLDVTTVPQLVDNEKLVGGFVTVLDMLRNKFNYEELHKVTKVVVNNLN